MQLNFSYICIMNTLKYKNYIGSVAYSEPDKVFFGKIEGIDGLVNYEGESVKELTEAFHEAVDDYLIFCEEHGFKPQKSYTGTFNVRISPDTHRDIAKLAAEAGISINAFVKEALCDAVQQPKEDNCSLVKGYGNAQRESALLMDSGPDSTIRLTVPSQDIDFVKELARRIGWKCEVI